jgi:AcrR family transcriptional regulator
VSKHESGSSKQPRSFFGRKGFYSTSVADLAQATGLTKGVLYHHFENKDALFFAVVQREDVTYKRQMEKFDTLLELCGFLY